jgi:hypothetical protein
MPSLSALPAGSSCSSSARGSGRMRARLVATCRRPRRRTRTGARPPTGSRRRPAWSTAAPPAVNEDVAAQHRIGDVRPRPRLIDLRVTVPCSVGNELTRTAHPETDEVDDMRLPLIPDRRPCSSGLR